MDTFGLSNLRCNFLAWYCPVHTLHYAFPSSATSCCYVSTAFSYLLCIVPLPRLHDDDDDDDNNDDNDQVLSDKKEESSVQVQVQGRPRGTGDAARHAARRGGEASEAGVGERGTEGERGDWFQGAAASVVLCMYTYREDMMRHDDMR